MVVDCLAGACCFPFCCFPCAVFFPCLLKGGGGAAAAGCCCCPGGEQAALSCCAAEHAVCACAHQTFCAPCMWCCPGLVAGEKACCGAAAAAMAPACGLAKHQQDKRKVAVENKYMPYEDEKEIKYDFKLSHYDDFIESDARKEKRT